MRSFLLSLVVLLGATSAFAGPSPEQVREASVVVVSGSADHMDQVLRKAGVSYVVVSPGDLPELPLHSRQVLMVNCRGETSQASRERVRRFVAAGGFLYTTDHTVKELLEPTFPNTIAFNGTTTQEQDFPLQLRGDEKARGLLKHLGDQSSQRWQLAGGGYLFKVLDPHKVEVLMESEEVKKRYGTGVLGVRFRYQDGAVIHVTGHFFSQPGQRGGVAQAGRAFEQLSQNVVSEKAADRARLDSLYNNKTRREVTLQSAPAPSAGPVPASEVTTQSLKPGAALRVLEKKDNYAKVRDDQGNEGWVEQDAL
ncbi:SH3 domain-containing protein [Hyalangium rubrum]|uniref:SH3 domain-containing protein n=1 Tax=Hyalangium rubrum TaxID=3103134 RepID=A0ABU5H1H6_9BACT|nr:SH3 domain-containing protein [Hyalangium sp. s54d21]MDY7227313.1 SH3 domain-containing protein [Hyalangium sp. s54d21]